MQKFRLNRTVVVLLMIAGIVSGCDNPIEKSQSPKPQASVATGPKGIDHSGHNHGTTSTNVAHDHSGWWCNEHGVPEEECGLCSSKLAAEFQKKNDWCKDHDRPDSQCFVCHPELEAMFAAKYVAKYGRQPPKPTVN